MPFGISESQPDCDGFATVKREPDGTFTTIGCHMTKQDAVDQMVVVSLSEEIEPLGQVDDTDEQEDSGTSTDSSVMMASTMTDLIEDRWCVTGADEKRIAYTTLDLRQADNGTTLYGYAALFDSPSEPMPFIEYVKRGAFSKTLNDGADVRLLIDHEGVPLARTKSGTMRLVEDERGLAVEADLDPMNPDAARVISAMKRGDLSQMSFAFRTIKDQFSDDRMVRELREVQLYDVSVVTFPAYEQTVAEIRSRLLQTEQTPPTLIPATTGIRVRRAQLALARHSK